MSITGVFFIPASANTSSAHAPLAERLRSAYGSEVVMAGRWELDHTLMRDTPSCLPPSAHAPNPPPHPRYMQFLKLSHYQNHGFICTSKSPEPPSSSLSSPSGIQPTTSATASSKEATGSETLMRTVPFQSTGVLFQHFMRTCEPLWCHRHTIAASGPYFDVGDFRVRIGDVRQTQPIARPRGTVVEIEWRGPLLITSTSPGSFPPATPGTDGNNSNAGNNLYQDTDQMMTDSGISLLPEESDIDAEYVQVASLIRELWDRFGIPDKGLREAILVPDLGKEIKERIRELKRDNLQPSGNQTHSSSEKPDRTEKHYRGPAEGLWCDDKTWGWGWNDQDEDPFAGVDLARQYMEIFKVNR